MSQSACIAKCPPKLDNECNYETWKRDIDIWCEFTDIPVKKQALAIHLSLSGRARVASSELSLVDLKHDDGVKTILTKLDNLFLPEKGRRQFTAFHNLYNLRRSETTSVKEFISEFEHRYFKFKQEDMDLPDPVMAFMLLSSCNLTENEVHLVMSALSIVTYSSMKNIIMRIFGSEIKALPTSSDNSVIEIKTEPTFTTASETNDSVLYTRGYPRGRGRARGGRGGRYSRGGGYSSASGYSSLGKPLTGANLEPKRKTNPVGNNGQVSRCLICNSKFHWERECRHSYENTASKNDEESENVHLSLFTGYTKGEPNTKLQNLIDETKNCALLDTGCTTSVWK